MTYLKILLSEAMTQIYNLFGLFVGIGLIIRLFGILIIWCEEEGCSFRPHLGLHLEEEVGEDYDFSR